MLHNIQNRHITEDRAEARKISYIMEHNIAFNNGDHLVQLIKAVAIVAWKLTYNGTKCIAFVYNATGKYAFETLLRTIQKNKFSVHVDESTDRSSNKH